MDISTISTLPISRIEATPLAPAPADADKRRELIRAIQAVNASALFGNDTELTYVLDRATHKAIARIVKRDTGEIVRQVPDEYVLRLAEESANEV